MVAYGARGERPRRRGVAQLIRADMLEPGSGEYVVPRTGLAEIFVWGGGGSGDSIYAGRGGGGGGAAWRRVALVAGQRLAFVVGAGGAVAAESMGHTGGSSIIWLPDGRALGATGGIGGSIVASSAPGGMGFGGTLNRAGGVGGASGAPGDAGQNGGAGGAEVSGYSGGGGSAGFDELGELFVGGDGSRGASSSAAVFPQAPGGGSGSTGGLTPAGGAGRIVILLLGQ